MPGCALFPVLVYIYGGSFDGGNNTLDTYSPDYLIEQNIVVVTINYRIGIFGFASTGDSVVPGNNGLKDQQLALLWIQDNIQQFCGNPNDVTISGQSAGSVSVSYHLQSQKSQGDYSNFFLRIPNPDNSRLYQNHIFCIFVRGLAKKNNFLLCLITVWHF